MSKLALGTRAAATSLRALEFAISALVLGIFSWYLACVYARMELPTPLLIFHRPSRSPPPYSKMGEGRRGYGWWSRHLYRVRCHPYLLSRRYHLLRFPRPFP